MIGLSFLISSGGYILIEEGYVLWLHQGSSKIANRGINENRSLIDYKFYCFDGEPLFLYISEGLENHETARISFLELDWRFAQFQRNDYRPFEMLPNKPENYNEMLQLARTLSKDIPFARIDLYEICRKVYFSEITFSPCSGCLPFDPPEWDLKLGEYIKLPKIT